ncbi:MAG: hypothetical protein IIA64_01515 [Planctomycetes bacterium]|nr:hypothetical protein [Planctomycetota bacterium]
MTIVPTAVRATSATATAGLPQFVWLARDETLGDRLEFGWAIGSERAQGLYARFDVGMVTLYVEQEVRRIVADDFLRPTPETPPALTFHMPDDLVSYV